MYNILYVLTLFIFMLSYLIYIMCHNKLISSSSLWLPNTYKAVMRPALEYAFSIMVVVVDPHFHACLEVSFHTLK